MRATAYTAESDPTLEGRLLAKRAIVGDCWEFTGCRGQRPRGKNDYGLIKAWGKLRKVNRVAAALWLGFDLDSGLHVCHRCDNPPCFNPAHLFVDTNLGNARDRHAKGRYQSISGSRSNLARLSEDDVREIRKLLASGQSQRGIARAFGVNSSAVHRIASGANWAHLK